jgi:hypothetical protein
MEYNLEEQSFFERERTLPGPDAALTESGGVTFYKEDLQIKGKYNIFLHSDKTRRTKIKKNAIGSISTIDEDKLKSATTSAVAWDSTTWRWVGGYCYNRAEDHPLWHFVLEGETEMEPAQGQHKEHRVVTCRPLETTTRQHHIVDEVLLLVYS